MTSGQISSRLDLTYAPSIITTQKLTERELDLLFEAMYDDYIGGQPSATLTTTSAAQAPQVLQTPTTSTKIADTALTPIVIFLSYNYSTHFTRHVFENPFAPPSTSAAESSSSQYVDPSNVYVDDDILVVQVNQSPHGIFIKCLKSLKNGIETCDPIGTPMEIKDKLDLDKNGTLVDATKYRSMIGALMYLYQADRTLYMLLVYVFGTRLSQLRSTSRRFSDADYAGCKDTFKSTFDGTQFLGKKTKHIVVRYHFIKKHVEKGMIELYFVKTDYQLADLFTKALLVDRFNYLVRRLGMRNLSPHELERLAKSQ
nr:retrotransposon protein, putative, unclassified [Tanacetum cinerariifolium]